MKRLEITVMPANDQSTSCCFTTQNLPSPSLRVCLASQFVPRHTENVKTCEKENERSDEEDM